MTTRTRCSSTIGMGTSWIHKLAIEGIRNPSDLAGGRLEPVPEGLARVGKGSDGQSFTLTAAGMGRSDRYGNDFWDTLSAEYDKNLGFRRAAVSYVGKK